MSSKQNTNVKMIKAENTRLINNQLPPNMKQQQQQHTTKPTPQQKPQPSKNKG